MASKKKPAPKKPAPKAKAKPQPKPAKAKAPAKTSAKLVKAGPTVTAGELRLLDINNIVPDPGNRQDTTHQDLEELAQSIKAHGVLQPICVRPHPGQADYATHMIVWGERRWRAAQIAGLPTIPAIIRTFENDEQIVLAQAIENLQRKDLNGIEVAQQLKRLRDDIGLKVTEIPERLAECGLPAMSRSYVSNTLRLLDLPKWAQDYIRDGKMTAKHGLVILPIADLTDVLKEIRKDFDEESKDDTVSAIRLEDLVGLALMNYYPRIGATYGQNMAKYPITKDMHEALGVRTIGGSQYITNLERHKELNAAEAKKQKEREGKRKAQAEKKAGATSGKSTTADAKPARTTSLWTLQGVLGDWLIARIKDRLAADTEGVIRRRIFLHAARGGESANIMGGWGAVSLQQIFQSDDTALAAMEDEAVLGIIDCYEIEEAIVVSQALLIDLDEYRLNEALLKELTEAELDDLIELWGATEIDGMPVSVWNIDDKRRALLRPEAGDAIRMPPILRAVYDKALQKVEQAAADAKIDATEDERDAA